MYTKSYAGIIGLTMLAFMGTSLAAQTTPPGPNPSLEIPRRQLELAVQAAAKLVVKPKVVCGMTVIPVDPKVDPKAIRPEPDPKTKSTIRQVAPGACR